MKRLALAATLAAALSTAATADTVEKLAEDYVALPDIQRMMDDMFAPDTLVASFRAGLPPDAELSEAQIGRIGALMSESMAEVRPDLEALMIDGMKDTFSAEEIGALIDFYSSEHGGAVMAKMQPYMAGVMAQLLPMMKERQRMMLPGVIEILQEKK